MRGVSRWQNVIVATALIAAGGVCSAGRARAAILELETVQTTTAGTTETIGLILSTAQNESVATFQFDIVTTEAELAFVQVTGLQPLADAQKSVSTSEIDSGRWRVVVAGFNRNVIAPGVLIDVDVALAGGAPEMFYPVLLDNVILSDPDARAVPVTEVDGGVDFETAAPVYHSADVSQDFVISLSELLRVVQLFNASELYCDASSEDGYGLAPGDRDCAPHSSDYRGGPDWTIDLTELLRIVQFFSVGGYVEASDTEDGFAPHNAAKRAGAR